jgi:ferredoxin
MGHLSHHKAYTDLQRRIDQLPAGFPDTEEAMDILRLLFSPEEAEMVSKMPLKPLSARRIARRVKRPEGEVTALLERMADRGLIFDMHNAKRDRMVYCVAPPVVGFFEFSLMRRRADLDQGALSHAFERYLESGSCKKSGLFDGETQIGRTLVHQATVSEADAAELLTHERATHIVEEASTRAVSLCYCRHKAEHLGRACSAPLENCMSLGPGADFVLRHGLGRTLSRQEALEILAASREASLVLIGDNVQRRVSYICSCCGCCCGQLQAINRYGLQSAVKTSPFLARIDPEACTGCGRCARRCPVQAIGLRALPHHVQRKARMYSVVDASLCLGCGVCQPACKKSAIQMKRRGQRVLTPESTLERILLQALERGKLQNLLFDEEEGLHQLFLKNLVGAVLRMPPVKRALLGGALRSRFLSTLTAGARRASPNTDAL